MSLQVDEICIELSEDHNDTREKLNITSKIKVTNPTSDSLSLPSPKISDDNSLQNDFKSVKNNTLHVSSPADTDFYEDANKRMSHMATSTPKKEGTKSYHQIESRDTFNEGNQNKSDESYDENDNDEFLNNTIEEAINKYEGQKYKEVFVQTSFDEYTAKCCTCSYEYKIKNKKFSPADCSPLKKFKMEKTKTKSPERVTTINQSNLNEYSAIQKEDCTNKIRSDIGKFSLKGTILTGIGEKHLEFSKTPRIRVGLSKRAKLPWKKVL